MEVEVGQRLLAGIGLVVMIHRIVSHRHRGTIEREWLIVWVLQMIEIKADYPPDPP